MPTDEYSFKFKGIDITAKYEWEFGSQGDDITPSTENELTLLEVIHGEDDISDLLKDEYFEEIQSECYKLQFYDNKSWI